MFFPGISVISCTSHNNVLSYPAIKLADTRINISLMLNACSGALWEAAAAAALWLSLHIKFRQLLICHIQNEKGKYVSKKLDENN